MSPAKLLTRFSVVLLTMTLFGALLATSAQAQSSTPTPTPTPTPEQDSGGDKDGSGDVGPRDDMYVSCTGGGTVNEGSMQTVTCEISNDTLYGVSWSTSTTGGVVYLSKTLGPSTSEDYYFVRTGTVEVRVDDDGTLTVRAEDSEDFASDTVTFFAQELETPDPPTNLSLSIESSDDDDLDLAYTRSESPHYYEFELHRSTSQYGTYTQTGSAVDDSFSPANFDNQDKGYWYRARGRNCETSSRTGCGDWSAWSNIILLPPDPSTNLSLSIEPNDDDDLDVTYTLSGPVHNYEFELHRSQTQHGTYSKEERASDSQSPADFDNQDKGYWYKAQGRNCGTFYRTNCGGLERVVEQYLPA